MLVMQSSRDAMKAMIPCPYLYFLRSLNGRVLIGSDFRLEDNKLDPVDPSRFGF